MDGKEKSEARNSGVQGFLVRVRREGQFPEGWWRRGREISEKRGGKGATASALLPACPRLSGGRGLRWLKILGEAGGHGTAGTDAQLCTG